MAENTTDITDNTVAPAVPTFIEALVFWLKLGVMSFGGPAGQIAIMHQELVEQRRWISERRFLHALNYCMVLPGPEAQQLATYIGWLMHGTRGGIAAGVLFVFPSLLILIALSYVYMAYGHTSLIAGIFAGIKPAVTVIVVQAVHRIGGRALHNFSLCLIALTAFIAIFVFNLPFPLILLSAALIGWCGSRYYPQHFQQNAHAGVKGKHYGKAVIDDESPSPAHAHFTWQSLSTVLLVGFLLWSLPMSALYFALGWQHTYTQMAWFFTKAALMTFGGAYAVLPYVMQAAVQEFRWISPRQMIDGLALGETTPGPLIMVLAFVGFVAAYAQALLGLGREWQAGALAACLVTWFTFLPSFIFIFAGAPMIETTHRQLSLTAPLSAITAAVVGVVLNLALFFAWHVLFPDGWNGGIDFKALFIALLAALALFRFKIKVMSVIAISALLGLFLQYLPV
ncbi:chromate efflux transporter [Undibacterium sp. LX40W]|uniref:Chromate efflux transporter n=1 Tax=Undibacterium nitidum TaxID=2762298 RepID=A0A923KU32_9BURK|nr:MULTISPECIES: chromate efflux transporter [Undibacterium]MBC3881852.1 chromate efflux transporter [Undibacterium nitidum]MBC3892151.1 chromate efflux transporter [Undibacterium sp. LX40W]